MSRIITPDAVKIHGNFIHHNQHQGKDGYGVAVNEGAYALIERNVFDFNRHAIKASPDPGTGYVAKYNLVLKGGGVHDGFLNTYTHLFDVHGDENCIRCTDPILRPVARRVWRCFPRPYAAGMVKEQIGAPSSSGLSLARVSGQSFGASSRYRSLGQYGSTRRISSRYC